MSYHVDVVETSENCTKLFMLKAYKQKTDALQLEQASTAHHALLTKFFSTFLIEWDIGAVTPHPLSSSLHTNILVELLFLDLFNL